MTEDPRIPEALATLRRTAASFDGVNPELAANLRWYADDFEHRRDSRIALTREDPRIREIRAVFDELKAASPGERDGYSLAAKMAQIAGIVAREPSAPRVWFPGDTVPRGAAAMNEDGDLVAGAYRVMAIDGPQVELATLSPEEWQAAVDRARDARADAEWQHTEGTNP